MGLSIYSRIGRIKIRFNRFRHQGMTWRAIGEMFNRSGSWAMRITKGDYILSEENVSYIESRLPIAPWETYKELDKLVLETLRSDLISYRISSKHFVCDHERRTGRYLAKFYGTTPRAIRGSIKRLREAGHNISASLAPPRGYRLEEEA